MAGTSKSDPVQLDLGEIVAAFPSSAGSMLLDHYLVDHATASARVFRVYRPTPAHFHRHSDEHLYVLSGTGTMWLRRPEESKPFGPGTFLFFPCGTPHAMPEMGDAPVVFLAIDTPRRSPQDIVFLNPEEGTPAEFIQAI